MKKINALPMTSFLTLFFSAFLLFQTSLAKADDAAQEFVQEKYKKLSLLIKQNANQETASELEKMVDFPKLVERSFGSPCPKGILNCQNHWNEFSDAQKSEISGLLRKLIEKNYKKNLKKTTDYEVDFKKTTEENGAFRVRSQAKSKTNAREGSFQIDYIVAKVDDQFKVVDMITEGSSLSKNYYTQFHRMLTTEGQGYNHVVKKLTEKLNSK